MVTVNEAHQNTAGPYTVEASIPMNFFTEGNFKITFAGVTVDLADIEVLDGSAIKEDTTEAVLVCFIRTRCIIPGNCIPVFKTAIYCLPS